MTTPTVGNNVQPWLETVHKMATMNKQIDGHLTIMAFTTGWKAMFGTPELSEAGRAELWQMVTSPTLEKALEIVYQDAMSEIEYWNEDAALHDQPVSSDAQEIEQIKAKAFEASADDDDLPPELDYDQLAEIARAWPWNVRDALGRFVAHAMTDAGITDRRQRIAVIERLAVLCGDINE